MGNEHRKSIATNYFRGWFLVDFVSTVPLDTLFSTMVHNSEALRGTKLIRMIRLVRLFKIFRLLKVRVFPLLVHRFMDELDELMLDSLNIPQSTLYHYGTITA